MYRAPPKGKTSIITVRNYSTIWARFVFNMSSDPVSGALGHAGIGVALGSKSAHAIVYWIPINRLFCVFRLDGSVRIRSNRLKHRYLFALGVIRERKFLERLLISRDGGEVLLSELRKLVNLGRGISS